MSQIKVLSFSCVRQCNYFEKAVNTEHSSMDYYSSFFSLLTFFSPWLVSQEATLLFPVSSGMDGGFSSSVPLAEALNPSLLS